jgi:hypothetical protein
MRLHNEELHKLYASSIHIKVIESRRGWAGHVARVLFIYLFICIYGMHPKFGLENLKGRYHLEDLSVGGRY